MLDHKTLDTEPIGKFRYSSEVDNQVSSLEQLQSKLMSETESVLDSDFEPEPQQFSSPLSSNRSPNRDSKIGYVEILCSLLSFVMGKLIPQDRALVTPDTVKVLKKKFFDVISTVEKFQKDIAAVEKIIVSGLGLTMTRIECKCLGKSTPVSPSEDEFPRAHDVDEVASRLIPPEEDIVNEETKQEDSGTYKSSSIPDEEMKQINANSIELHWDSSNKDKIFCKNSSEYSPWLEFDQMHITGQLRLIHAILDEILREFENARVLLKDAKLDLSCARKLLQKTWKGIIKDLKRGRIPDSGILVLSKLYRYHIASTAINTKAIRRTTREVRFLLGQSVQIAKFWTSESQSSCNVKNYVMTNANNLLLNVRLQ